MDAPEAITPEPSPHTHGHLADGLLTKPIYTALIALIESRQFIAVTAQAGRFLPTFLDSGGIIALILGADQLWTNHLVDTPCRVPDKKVEPSSSSFSA